jgi:hypothetical protein
MAILPHAGLLVESILLVNEKINEHFLLSLQSSPVGGINMQTPS